MPTEVYKWCRDAARFTLPLEMATWKPTECSLKQGADPNAADQQGHTPVMAICNTDGLGAAQRVAALREVLDAGGDSSLANIYGHTAMHFAVSREDSTGLIDVLWSKRLPPCRNPTVKG